MPASSNLRVNQLLTQYTTFLRNNESSFVADRALPVKEVDSSQGKYYKIDGGFGFGVDSNFGLRSAGSKFNRDTVNVSQVDLYTCKERGHERVVDDDEVDEAAENEHDLKQTASELAYHNMMLGRELRAAALLFSATVFSGYTEALNGNDRWDDDSSKPIQKTAEWADLVEAQTGVPQEEQTLLLGADVWRHLSGHSQLLESMKYTSGGVGRLDTEAAARILRFKEIIVGRALYNSAEENTAGTVTQTRVWGKYALVYVRRETPNPLSDHGVGFTAVRRGRLIRTSEYREEPRSNVVLVDTKEDMVVSTPKAGYLGSTVVS